jgi:hypothetical protein
MKQFGEEIGNNPATAFATRIRANQEKLGANLEGQFDQRSRTRTSERERHQGFCEHRREMGPERGSSAGLARWPRLFHLPRMEDGASRQKLDQDTLMRISLVIGIYKALNIYFSKPWRIVGSCSGIGGRCLPVRPRSTRCFGMGNRECCRCEACLIPGAVDVDASDSFRPALVYNPRRSVRF